ncbi:MAG: class A beta-lactamase-related serine hydrolase [Cyclobacteriaceae bacterium]|nr:MAG: class A beta-lactamase-related serine hydrolase [Cyclobacteriaceae bacterium]
MRKLLAVCLVVLLGCSHPPTFEKEIDTIFSYLNGNTPGGAVLILKNDSVVFSHAYGLADLPSKEKITTKTLFNTGSISKTFVAYVILELAHEGKLSLNDSIARYFPDFKNPQLAQKVRVHHLLTHTSGLPDNRRQHLDSVFLLTAKDQENFNPIKLADSLQFEPGTRYEYSNPAFNGLALIIEQVTGNKWQDEVKNRIFIPAGMQTSTITDGPYPTSGVAHAYLKTATGFIEKDYGEEPTFAAAGNGGVWSSVEELALYEKALRDTKILNADIINTSRTIRNYPHWQDTVPPFIGASWFIGQTDEGYKMIYHTGTQGGFYGDYVSIPEKGIVYVMLCNIPTPQEKKRSAVLSILKKYNWLD